MKRILAILLAGFMLLSLAACGEKKDELINAAMLEADGLSAAIRAHDAEKHPGMDPNTKQEIYANLSTAIMDLKNGKLDYLSCEKTTADYIVAHNENFEVFVWERLVANFSMLTMEENKEVYDILNNAIVEMKADGTLDSLIKNELKAYIESDPVAKDLPHFDGAKTIKIGVTGDLPPMDFVASNGKAAGFNIALLAEIANRAQVNIKLVQIETGARTMALSSGKVDAVFWTKSLTCTECNETYLEEMPGTIATESYFSDASAAVLPKSDK